MIEKFFRKPHVRRRLERGPMATVVSKYLGRLEARGYSPSTIHQYVQALEHFGRWLVRSGRDLLKVGRTILRFSFKQQASDDGPWSPGSSGGTAPPSSTAPAAWLPIDRTSRRN